MSTYICQCSVSVAEVLRKGQKKMKASLTLSHVTIKQKLEYVNMKVVQFISAFCAHPLKTGM